MATNIPSTLSYTAEHEWAQDLGGGVIAVGVTDYAQDSLGDITYLELPEVGAAVTQGATFGVIESVKTFSDLYAPVSGEIVERNEAVVGDPAVINNDAYGNWLVKIRVADAAQLGALLNAGAYEQLLATQG